MTFQTPRVVFDLRHHVTLLQAEVENLRLLLLLHLIAIITEKKVTTTREKVSASVLQNVFFMKASRCHGEHPLTS